MTEFAGRGARGWPPQLPAPATAAQLGIDRARRRQLFEGAPRDVLARLGDGDPLGLAERCLFALREFCLMLDPGRLYQRVEARIAHAARTFDEASDELDQWIDARIEQSVADLLVEDWNGHVGAEMPREGWERGHQSFARMLGVSPTQVRGMSVRFNALPLRKRAIFHRTVLQSTELETVALSYLLPLHEARAMLKEAIVTMVDEAQGEQPRPDWPRSDEEAS